MAKRKNLDADELPAGEIPNGSPTEGPVNGEKPLEAWSYPVGKNVFINVSVWPRKVDMSNGDSFVTHDIRVQKRWKDLNEPDPTKQWKSAHAYRVSELFTLMHAIEKAGEYVLGLRKQQTSL